ncbi:MAG: ABC transporter ATP-binding protein [Thermodesulfobacteriota bacterium]
MPAQIGTKQQNNSLPDSVVDDVVVSVRNVSKKFCKNLRRSMAYGISDLSKNLIGIKPDVAELRKDEFWAIDDISFQLGRGEVLGLIGVNGSGKSTLLRLLTGIFPPDKGDIRIMGRVGALIAVGAGFHPYMTGKENIFLNATILGMTRQEIKVKFNDIVDFAEIGDFLDAPVATYSSGMRVRLGFSIAVHMNPDVTIVDEVLAVGDFNFRQKCSERINELRHRTATIFVSHNLRDIKMLCTKAIVMDKGQAVFEGPSFEAVEFYLNMTGSCAIEKDKDKQIENKRLNQVQHKDSIFGEIYHNNEKITDVHHQWIDEVGNYAESFEHGREAFIKFSFRLLKPVNKLVLGVPIYDSNGNLITGISTDMEKLDLNIQSEGLVSGKLQIKKMSLNPGEYITYIAIMDGKEFIYRNIVGNFTVREMPFYFGVYTPEYNWIFDKTSS